MKLTREEASQYGKRSQPKRRESLKWCIEGQYVTVDEIAARLGVHYETANKRLQRLRKKPDPVTWAALGLSI